MTAQAAFNRCCQALASIAGGPAAPASRHPDKEVESGDANDPNGMQTLVTEHASAAAQPESSKQIPSWPAADAASILAGEAQPALSPLPAGECQSAGILAMEGNSAQPDTMTRGTSQQLEAPQTPLAKATLAVAAITADSSAPSSEPSDKAVAALSSVGSADADSPGSVENQPKRANTRTSPHDSKEAFGGLFRSFSFKAAAAPALANGLPAISPVNAGVGKSRGFTAADRSNRRVSAEAARGNRPQGSERNALALMDNGWYLSTY